MKKIDFEYSFAQPHTITLSRPSASEKTIVEVAQEGIRFMWTFSSQKTNVPLAWTQYPMDVYLSMNLSVNKQPTQFSKWYRHESGIPYVFAEGEANEVQYVVSAIATPKGVVVKCSMENSSQLLREVHIQMAHTNMWVISNKGWIDGIHKHVLISGNQGRADRLLVVASGADSYPMYGSQSVGNDSEPPMSNAGYNIADNSMKKITAYCCMAGGERKTVYYLLPYNKYFDDLSDLETLDLEKEIHKSVNEWKKILRRGATLKVGDKDFLRCYYACLADLFVMRERIGRYWGIACGTKEYRSANSSEPLEAEILLDTLGYTREAEKDYPMYLDGQDADGCWVTRKGWEHEGWGWAFNKANAVLTHYLITLDKVFLEKYYSRMYASTMFNDKMRRSTQTAPVKAERGLMPRGMGDCGLMNNADYYGVFYPMNALSVGADYLTLEAAKILGKTEDVEVLRTVCEEAKNNLLKSMRENVIEEQGCVRTASIPNAAQSSLFGCLYAFFPCELVEKDEPMIAGSVRCIQTKQMSEGGLPIGTGWLKNGLWVAMALNNIARTYLRMGLYEQANSFLYPAINHASPLITWCEERGAEKGSKIKTGDMQHLWTPLSVLQYTIDALFFENKTTVHLFSGICPEWMNRGEEIRIKGLKTAYGDTELSLKRKENTYNLYIKTTRKIMKEVVVHYYTDQGLQEQKICPNGSEIHGANFLFQVN